jgi:hypothetical protein
MISGGFCPSLNLGVEQDHLKRETAMRPRLGLLGAIHITPEKQTNIGNICTSSTSNWLLQSFWL